MNLSKRLAAMWLLIGLAWPAWAGEEPLYRPAPDWVVTADLPAPADDAPGQRFLMADSQTRVEDGRLWGYSDEAVLLDNPQALAEFATLTLSWFPDKGDLIIHEVSMIRGGAVINALADGQKFTVLRREQMLEQLQIDGLLTATLPVEGLRLGDILRVRSSFTLEEDALDDHVQFATVLPAEPLPIAAASTQLSWPEDEDVRWQIVAEDAEPRITTANGFKTVRIALPVAEQPQMPEDAPVRYQHPPILELSAFADWAEVSRVMAPLYRTEETVAPGSELSAVVEEIARASNDPLVRTAQVLRLVQDEVRYLAVGMDGGNYVPQTPAETWRLRYGDCKAKTLLLLALLAELEVDAEPVLANITLGDFVPKRLPSALAFDHVLVRARVAGRPLWLDGTTTGTRLPDLGDTPMFGHVLPVRAAGASLEQIDMRPPARPVVDLTLVTDESDSVDLPSVMDVTAVIRGPIAAQVESYASSVQDDQRDKALASFLQPIVGDAQFEELSLDSDEDAGTITISARGVFTTAWKEADRNMERPLSRLPSMISFSPDRGRPAWRDVPVATDHPNYGRSHLRIRLPKGGEGYRIEGEPDLSATVAGYEVERRVTREGEYVTVEERFMSSGAEVPAERVAAERERAAIVRAQVPKLVAPKDARRRWDVSLASAGASASAGSGQAAAVEEILAQAIASSDPDDPSAHRSRSSFRLGIGDLEGAEADLTAVIGVEPTARLYLTRGYVRSALGDLEGALTDAEQARTLDPAAPEAIAAVADYKGQLGDLTGALALIDERIEIGGDMADDFRAVRAALLTDYGDAELAIAAYDALLEKTPAMPNLLNSRCWAKALHDTMLDSALKDCTGAIEMGREVAPYFDSRALVWLRMGRFDNALQDAEAALREAPDLMPARWIRGLALEQLGRSEEAAREFEIVRRMAPQMQRLYARYGLVP